VGRTTLQVWCEGGVTEGKQGAFAPVKRIGVCHLLRLLGAAKHEKAPIAGG
jgi:hypothetical protein